MKKTLLPLLTIAGVFALVSNVNAASNSADGTITSKAKILTGLTANGTKILNFGSFSRGEGGTITITPMGVVTNSDPNIIHSADIPTSNGKLEIVGEPNSTVTLFLPTVNTNLTRSGGTETMVLSDYTTTEADLTSVSLDESGSKTVGLGGKLNVGNATANPAGNYEGTYSITVTYN